MDDPAPKTNKQNERPINRRGAYLDRVLLVCVLLLQSTILIALITRLNFKNEGTHKVTQHLKKSHHAGSPSLASSPRSQGGSAGSFSEPSSQLEALQKIHKHQTQNHQFFNLFNFANHELNPILSRMMNRSQRTLDSQMNLMVNQALSDLKKLDQLMGANRGWKSVKPASAMDMREFNDHYLVHCSMQGWTKKDADKNLVKANLTGRLLTISAAPSFPKYSQLKTFMHRVWIPGPVMDASHVQAKLTNGILRIAIPKKSRLNLAKLRKQVL